MKIFQFCYERTTKYLLSSKGHTNCPRWWSIWIICDEIHPWKIRPPIPLYPILMSATMKQMYNIIIASILPILYNSSSTWNAVIETGAIIATTVCKKFHKTNLRPIHQDIIVPRDFSSIQNALTMFDIFALEGHFTHVTEGPQWSHCKVSHWSKILRLSKFISY